MKFLQYPFLPIFLWMAAFWGTPSSIGAEEKLPPSIKAVVSIAPLKSLADAVLGPGASCRTLVASYATPHVFDPKPSDVQSLSEADIFIKVGLNLEEPWASKLIKSASNSQLKVISLEKGIPVLGNPIPNPHIWVSPRLARLMVKNLRDALAAQFPNQKETFFQNAQNFDQALEILDKKFQTSLSSIADKRYVATRPEFTYIARDYGLMEVEVITGPHGHSPSIPKMTKIIKMIIKEKIPVLMTLVQAQDKFPASIKEETGIALVDIDMFGVQGEDYIQLMEKNLAAIMAGFNHQRR